MRHGRNVQPGHQQVHDQQNQQDRNQQPEDAAQQPQRRNDQQDRRNDEDRGLKLPIDAGTDQHAAESDLDHADHRHDGRDQAQDQGQNEIDRRCHAKPSPKTFAYFGAAKRLAKT